MLIDVVADRIGVLTVLVVLAGAFYSLRQRGSPFPCVNQHHNDFFHKKAFTNLQKHARGIIREGLARHGGPITIAIPHGEKIVLPASLASWVKSNKDLDHRDLVRDDFLAGYPGFESQTVLHSEDDVIKTIIRSKLSQNPAVVQILNASISRSLQRLWGDDQDWKTLHWQDDTSGVIAQAASSVFVGPEKSNDEEWLRLVQEYVTSYFTAVGELRAYPRWARSIVQWLLPNATACRRIVPRARVIINGVLAQRNREAEQAMEHGTEPPEYHDALSWTQLAGAKAEPGDMQLSLAMAALFTTSEAFRQVLVEVARHPEIIEPLRREIVEQFSMHGITIPAMVNMTLLDSVLKESQRLSSSVVALERMALKDVTLPDGQTIPRGSHIMVDSTHLWESTEYPDPEHFDGYRFQRKREAGDTSSQFVQSSADYLVFGGGRHICPGRFLANHELKLALAHVLLKYDIRLGSGCDPALIPLGFYAMVDPGVRLEVRRRGDSDGDVLD